MARRCELRNRESAGLCFPSFVLRFVSLLAQPLAQSAASSNRERHWSDVLCGRGTVVQLWNANEEAGVMAHKRCWVGVMQY